MADDDIALYDSSFYDAQADQSLRSARNVLPRLFSTYRPNSVIDVGCGVGTWLRAALDLGIEVGLGLDGAYVETDQLVIPAALFSVADLAKPGLMNIAAGHGHSHFDLVICLEVAEHLPFERSASLVHELCQLGDVVLFSAAIPFQHGTGHINEQWAEFWALLFRSRGFRCFDLLRNEFWSHPGVNWWYAQNMLVFVKESSAAFESFPVAEMDGPLSRVHPMIWLSSILYHWRPYRATARGHEEADFKALVQGWAGGDLFPPALRTVEQAREAGPDIRGTFPETRMIVGNPESEIADALAKWTQSLQQRDLEAERARIAFAEYMAEAERKASEDLKRAMNEKANAETALVAEKSGRLQAEQDYHGALRRLETSAAANTTLRQQVARYINELAASREQAQARSAEIAELLIQREQLISKCRQLAAELVSQQHWVAAMLSSTSWRMTAPIRAVRQWLR